jgi:segregation and condensation protein A
MPYDVTTSVYEGPFDLLLHLILRQEVDLWEVSLTTIVDAYLTEIERMDTLDLEVATEFLLVAATLVELKTRRLLPGPAELELDEELLRFEERDLLLARLLECKTFKDAADALAAMMRRADRSLARTSGPEEPFRSILELFQQGLVDLEQVGNFGSLLVHRLAASDVELDAGSLAEWEPT